MKSKNFIVRYSALSLIILISLFFNACKNDDTEKTSKIALTSENYSEYLDITVFCAGSGENVTLSTPIPLSEDYSQSFAHSEITANFITNKVSPELKFENVNIKLAVTGQYKAHSVADISKTLEEPIDIAFDLETDTAGEGKISQSVTLPDGYVTLNSLLTYKWEVMEISGTVSK